jgi:hypothetical protein
MHEKELARMLSLKRMVFEGVRWLDYGTGDVIQLQAARGMEAKAVPIT